MAGAVPGHAAARQIVGSHDRSPCLSLPADRLAFRRQILVCETQPGQPPGSAFGFLPVAVTGGRG